MKKIFVLHFEQIQPWRSTLYSLFDTEKEAKAEMKLFLMDEYNKQDKSFIRIYTASDKIYCPVSGLIVKERGVTIDVISPPMPFEIIEYKSWGM